MWIFFYSERKSAKLAAQECYGSTRFLLSQRIIVIDDDWWSHENPQLIYTLSAMSVNMSLAEWECDEMQIISLLLCYDSGERLLNVM